MKVNSRNIYGYNPQEDSDKLDIKSAILRYLKAWPIFVGSIVVALIAAYLVNSFTPPIYKVQGKFLIKEESYSIDVFDNAGKEAILQKGQKIANEAIIIKSRSTAEDVLNRLPFDVEYYNDGLFNDAELYTKSPISIDVDWEHSQLVNGNIRISWNSYETFTLEFLEEEYQRYSPDDKAVPVVETPLLLLKEFRFGEWLQFPHGRFMVKLTGQGQSGSVIVRLRNRESLIQQYTGDNLQVVPADKISSILLLTLDTHQPYKGRDYLNMLMKVFLENELDEKNIIARNTIQFIDSQLSGISDSLHQTENKLERYRSTNRTYNITTEGNTLFERLVELEKSLSQETFKRQYLQGLQQYLVGEQYAEITVPSGMGIDDPLLNKLIQDLVTFQAEKSRLLSTQTENSPAVIEVNRKIKDLNRSITEALKNANHATNLMIADLTGRISRIEGQFGKLPQTEQDLLAIKRKYSLNESIYTFLLQRRAEASIILASNTPSNKIVEEAALNLMPMKLRPMLNYFLAAILGLLIPVAFIALKEFFNVKIHDLKDTERKLMVPVIASIGQNRNETPLVVLKHSRARITEAFRALRTNIDFLVAPEKQLTILVTSGIAGEGKSFCSLNLASVYSVCEKKTIIVRCDMHKSFSIDSLGIPNSLGLSNFLMGQVKDVDDIIRRTDYSNLEVMVSGPVPPKPAELLAGERFKSLLSELKRRYEVVILDSSPIGLTNETLYLTRMVDFTVYVLRYNYSNKGFIDDINSLREKKKIKNLYALVNDIPDKELHYGTNGYGYYEEDHRSRSTLDKISQAISRKAAI